jgi:RNA polymerase sigma factor (sigma-70 family)
MAKHTSAVIGAAIRAAAGSAAESDRELLRRFAAGDQVAFAALFGRHSGMVLGVCRRTLPRLPDAEDACQATFLVLSRKAGSGRWQQSVANWLYLTARRVARNARVAAERRVRHEGRAAVPEAAQPVDRMTGRELLETLDAELDRLPPTYREPLVLCYLEGLTRDEAATRLGVPAATLKSRLERGRKRLGDALTKRGCVLGAGLLALAATSPADASPLRLVEGVLAAAAGSPTATVAALAEGVAMNGIGKAKLLAMVVLAGAVVLGFRAVSPQPVAFGRPPENAMPAGTTAADGKLSNAPKVAPEHGKEIALTGRVLDPDGNPFPGAKLLHAGGGDALTEVGVSGKDGRFSVSVPAGRRDPYLVARSEGYGIDFVSLNWSDVAGIELRLVKDRALRGRIVDTQGKPVAGVTVGFQYVRVFEGAKGFYRGAGSVPLALTDARGQFTLHGLGADREVMLRISGGGVAQFDYLVANRDGFDPKPYNDPIRMSLPKEILLSDPNRLLVHGPDQDIVAEAEMPIRGVVTAADTSKGRPGTVVRLTGGANNLAATTDAAGRYEIQGARKAKAYTLRAESDAGAGYLARVVRMVDAAGYTPVTADIRVVKGVILKGKVLETSTGKGLPGQVLVDVLAKNPFVNDYPPFDNANLPDRATTAEDGSFRMVTIPGPVILVGSPDVDRMPYGSESWHRYKQRFSDPNYPQYFPRYVRGHMPYDEDYFSSRGRSALQGVWCKVLEIEPGTAVVEQDVLLEPAPGLPLQLRDPAGKPLAGVYASGISPRARWGQVRCKTDVCHVYDLQPGDPRLLVFYHPTRKLAATLTLKGDEKAPQVVTLQPMATVKGRLVRADGTAAARLSLGLNYWERAAGSMNDLFRHVQTGADGVFTIDAVLPGLPFHLGGIYGVPRQFSFSTNVGGFKAEAGKTKDLGDLPVKTEDP